VTGPRRGSLVVVGTGISLAAQTTIEALECMKRAEKLFYLVTDPATEAWVRQLNPAAESLEDSYAAGKARSRTYQDMTARIVAAVRSGMAVCAAFYGHPGVFVNASHAAIRRVRRLGLPARMQPGISADACLFADLGVNPGDVGCQSFEATDFLGCRRRFDPSSALILWQVGVLGESSVRKGMSCRPERLRALTRYLRRHYPARHPIVLYEAAQFPVCDPVITRIPLAKLPDVTIMAMTTLYIAPKASRPLSRMVDRWMDE
jgi:precorrin-3B methylase